MIDRMIPPIDFENVFISTALNISNIESKEDSDINESKEFNTDVQIYLIFEKEHEEFTVININLSIVKNDNEEYLYKKNDPYLEFNNVEHYNIIQMNCIYNYYTLYLGFKAINNFFFKTIFKLIKKMYTEKETRHWIFTIRTAIYRTFISSLEHLPIYMKEEAILKRY